MSDKDFLNSLADGVREKKPPDEWDVHTSVDEVERVIDEWQQYLDFIDNEKGLHNPYEGRDRITFMSRGKVVPRDCVVKVSMNNGYQNRDAIRVWNEMDEKARDCVAPLVDWANDERWIVQKRASHVGGKSQKVMKRLKDAGWTCSDIRSENVGKLNGKYVLIDLGVGLRKI